MNKTSGQRRVLLLSCNTGEGHNAAARALMEQLERRGVQAECKDALSFAPPGVSQLVSGVHKNVYRNVPSLFDAGYTHTERRDSRGEGNVPYRLSALYAPKLYRYVMQGAFDAVVAPHVFPAVALTWLRRHDAYAGMRRIPCCFVATDYTCSPFVGQTELDLYCIPHAALADEFVQKGIPRSKLLPVGIPVRSEIVSRVPRAQARRVCSLPENGRVLLLMSGSMGAGGMQETCAALVPRLGPRDRLVCLCGNNRHLLSALQEAHRCDPRVLVLPYIDRVSLLMDAADLLLTKPGGLTVTEAAAKGLPLVLTDAVGGCETRNATFFQQHGMAAVAQGGEPAARLAFELLEDAPAREAMSARQRATLPADAAERLIEALFTNVQAQAAV